MTVGHCHLYLVLTIIVQPTRIWSTVALATLLVIATIKAVAMVLVVVHDFVAVITLFHYYARLNMAFRKLRKGEHNKVYLSHFDYVCCYQVT